MNLGTWLQKSWWTAGILLFVLLACLLAVIASIMQLSSQPDLVVFAFILAIFLSPSVFLNWVFDRQSYLGEDKDWLILPKTIPHKMLQIFTGALALWNLLFIGIILAGTIISVALDLGRQAFTS